MGKSQTPLHGHQLRTPATNTSNGQAHNNSTTNLPHRNARACQDVGMWHIFVRWCCSLVMFVAGVHVVEFGSKAGSISWIW